MKGKKKIGVLELTGYGIGNCIGSGIFVSMGLGIAATGRSLPLALIVSNVVVLFAYAYRTLMAGMFALPGGKYSQQALLQPPLLVGANAISNLLAGFAFAMYAMSVVEYAGVIFPGILPYEKLIALAIVTLFFVTTLFGAKFMAFFNLAMVVVMMISLLLYIAVGLPRVQPGAFALAESGYFRKGAVGFFIAVATMAFACQGATMPIEMTADAKNPKRSLPRAILLATVVVTVFYCAVSVVSVGVLPVDQVANQNLGTVAQEIFSRPVFLVFVLGGACFAIATSLYTAIAGVQHPMLATIEDGWLPASLGKRTKGGYPWLMMIVLYAVATIPIFLDMGLEDLISFLVVPNMIVNIVNNILFLSLVKKYPKAWKESFFHMPKFALIATISFALICDLLISVALFTTITTASQIGMAVIIVLLFAYSFYRLKAGKVNLHSIEQAKEEAAQAANA